MDNIVLNKKPKMPLKRVIFILSFILIPTVNFLIFYVYVNFDGIVMAFYTPLIDGGKEWGFQHFSMFFQDISTGELKLAFINTFKTFGINLIIFPWGIVVAYFLYKKIFGYKVFRVLFFLPSVINSIIVVIVYKSLVDIEGPIAYLIKDLFNLEEAPALLSEPRFANAFVWIHMLWLSFPGDMIIWGGAFARIPESVIESARLDGASWTTELTKIILPMIWPTFALKFIMLFATIFSSTGAVFLLTRGNADTMTFAVWQYLIILDNPPSSSMFNYMSAVGIMVTLVAMLIVALCKYFENKFFKDVDY